MTWFFEGTLYDLRGATGPGDNIEITSRNKDKFIKHVVYTIEGLIDEICRVTLLYPPP